jgi:hypothetical protein
MICSVYAMSRSTSCTAFIPQPLSQTAMAMAPRRTLRYLSSPRPQQPLIQYLYRLSFYPFRVVIINSVQPRDHRALTSWTQRPPQSHHLPKLDILNFSRLERLESWIRQFISRVASLRIKTPDILRKGTWATRHQQSPAPRSPTSCRRLHSLCLHHSLQPCLPK